MQDRFETFTEKILSESEFNYLKFFKLNHAQQEEIIEKLCDNKQ